MLDIIIPTYKNKEGLRKTLHSIQSQISPEITVTIVDDYSNFYYNDILEEFPFAQIFYNYKNIGPGMTRQFGIENTSEPYITFIDTADIFLNDQALPNMLKIVKGNPDVVLFTWQYLLHGNISDEKNNRMHGRVYKREFLDKYNIEFCPAASYTNEDIGFNRLCKLVIRDKKLKTLIFDEPVIDYVTDENSITNRNRGEFFYNQQNMGLALNTIHTIQIAEQNNLSYNLILEEMDLIMASLYYTFLCTCYERPEFIQAAWDGAKLFYDECFSIHSNDSLILTTTYNIFVKRIYTRAKYWKNFKPLNYNRFLNDLEKNKKIPSWYKLNN